MMSPFPMTFDLPDASVCAQCGHPIWDASEHASCAECDSRERAVPCSLFLLNDFTAFDHADAAATTAPSR